MNEFPDCAIPAQPRKARGAAGNPAGRFESWTNTVEDDGWHREADPRPLRTTLEIDSARSVIVRNGSPDVPFDQSLNNCFARPSHAYLGLSPGLDFESRLFHKPDAPQRLAGELSRPAYRCRPFAVGVSIPTPTSRWSGAPV